MIFINNKYTVWYNHIILTAQSRSFKTKNAAKKELGYVENHHIIPKSLGGNNAKINLVWVTAREHFICHWLLTKMLSGESYYLMVCALSKMQCSNKFQERYITKITSRVYENVRSDHAKFMSAKFKGIPTGPHKEESILLMVKKAKESWESGARSRTQSAEHIQKRANALLGKSRADESKKRISSALTGKQKSYSHKQNMKKPKTSEHRAKLSEAGKATPKLTCPHCSKIGSMSNMKRWHFDNCKSLPR